MMVPAPAASFSASPSRSRGGRTRMRRERPMFIMPRATAPMFPGVLVRTSTMLTLSRGACSGMGACRIRMTADRRGGWQDGGRQRAGIDALRPRTRSLLPFSPQVTANSTRLRYRQLLFSFDDLQDLELEEQDLVGADGTARRAMLAVCQVRRDGDLPPRALFHELHGLGPSRDDALDREQGRL